MKPIALPKQDGISNQPADEMNGVFNELQNIITGSGQTLSAGDNNQIGKAVAIYAAGGDYYIDSGSANTYVLTPISSKQAPPAYFDGMRARFIPANTNNGASTASVASLGSKNIKTDLSGVNVIAGVIQKNRINEIIYNATGGYFVLANPKSAFRAYQTVSQNIASTVGALITLGSESFDSAGVFNTSTSRFLPLIPGFYHVTGHLRVSGTIDPTAEFFVGLRTNGTFASANAMTISGPAADQVAGITSNLVFLNGSTDYVDMAIGHNNPTAIDTDALVEETYMFGYKVC